MRLNEEWFVSINQMVNDNELNNIIYICLKYTFGRSIKYLDRPKNSDIKNIMMVIGDDRSVDNIIDKILDYVKAYSNFKRHRIPKYRSHMAFLYKSFMQYPTEIRNDLGADEGSEDFIVKH